MAMRLLFSSVWFACTQLTTVTTLRAVEETWVYAVQLSATVQADPARIELKWPTYSHPVSGYTVHRKLPRESAWGAGVDLPASAASYVDENVTVGTLYEYQVVKQANYPHNGPAYKGYGYIATGINAPLVEQRGRVILVVDATIAAPLAGELERLQRDLVGDGWSVVRKDVGRDDRPAHVRALIRAEYAADRERTRAVFLLGHIPVVKSGNLNVDGHEARPMPADVFYGDIDGEWPDADGDGVYDPGVLTSDVELQVGRVDFADLTGQSVNFRFPTELELLKRYLDKDHAYRHTAVRPTARALVGNPAGDANGQAYAASGYRNFAVLVGHANVHSVEAQMETPVADRFVTALGQKDYLWVYGCGAGGDFAVNTIGANGEFNGLWSSDFIRQPAKGTFYQFFGSWFADWSKADNLLRSALTAPDYGLAASWSGRPHHFFHHMGMGETLGYGIRTSQNNSGATYQNEVQRQLRGVHIALMGDPTLRMNILAPPSEITASDAAGTVQLTWKASTDTVLGYHVYRSINGDEYTRLSSELVNATSFADPSRPNEAATYLVRAVALHVGPSGSYYHASQGVFASIDAMAKAAASRETTFPFATKVTDVVWFDDLLPSAAVPLASENDRWEWVASNPQPFSGALAHRSTNAAGLHHHFFAFAEAPLVVNEGDTLFAYVYLDPTTPPRQIMLTWLAGDWEHRTYWGENLIAEGLDGTAARRHAGALPPAGQWVRLEIPAHVVGMENRTATGMGFTVFDGRATWDRAGKSRE
jgi:hypothetical protein